LSNVSISQKTPLEHVGQRRPRGDRHFHHRKSRLVGHLRHLGDVVVNPSAIPVLHDGACGISAPARTKVVEVAAKMPAGITTPAKPSSVRLPLLS